MVINLKKLRAVLSNELKKSGLESHDADISVILMHILNIDKTQLVLGNRTVSDDEYELIRKCIERLKSGEPVQYIVGSCEFMSLKFIVSPDVLIPRADTEILVETVLDKLNENSYVADFCCGSGCIGISLAHYRSDINILGIDISDSALKIAKKNADLNGVKNKIKFSNMDLLCEMPNDIFDCIVSNPPYIRSDIVPALNYNVREMEPHIALDGGTDGLLFYRRIAEAAPLKGGGLIAFEIGFDQGKEVYDILAQNGYTNICIIKDIENRDRVVVAIKSLEV